MNLPSLPQAGVSLGAPALPLTGTRTCRVPRALCPCQCPQGGHPDPPARPKDIPALPWPGGCTSGRCDHQGNQGSLQHLRPPQHTNQCGTGAGLNSPSTKWPYQPEVLRASPPFPVVTPASLPGDRGRTLPSLTDSRVPPPSAPALALMQLGWAWTTVSTWAGPAHPSLPPHP